MKKTTRLLVEFLLQELDFRHFSRKDKGTIENLRTSNCKLAAPNCKSTDYDMKTNDGFVFIIVFDLCSDRHTFPIFRAII